MGQLRHCPYRNSKCKGPEVETCLVCGRTIKANVAGTALARRREMGGGQRGGETRLGRALRTLDFTPGERDQRALD